MKKKQRKKRSGNGFYRAIAAIFGGLVRFVFRVRTTGLENLPQEGGFILCANHIGYPDAVLLVAALPCEIRFLGKKEIFKVPLLGSFVRAMGAVPVDRNAADVGAIKKMIALAKAEHAITVFPQGHRRHGQNPADTEIKHGIGMIAAASGVPVVPVCIKMKRERYALFRRVNIIVGTPMTYREICGEERGRSGYEKATQAFFGATCLLGGYTPSALPPATSVPESSKEGGNEA